jgi:2-polyprenyl-3-methyl-5-hydroxy-6-metoxy-1,4-benzoquinol methylase
LTDRPASDHYSYAYYADRDNARAFEARRFGGPIGELVAERQARALIELAGPVQGRTILDVGTGTGRAALLFAGAGARVTGVDASHEMLAVARERAHAGGADVVFAEGDAHALKYGDRSFDIAVSLRVLMHTPRWRTCVHELCRVANQLVIVDYPSACSAALAQSLSRRIAAALGRETEAYRVFSDREVAAALEREGFRVRAAQRLFALPIAVHKTIGSRRFTIAVERALGRVGMLSLFGSPVTIVAERCTPS